VELSRRKEQLKRKKYFNELQNLKGNIRVFVRVRPAKDGSATSTRVTANGELMVDPTAGVAAAAASAASSSSSSTAAKKLVKAYEFDHVFGESASQAEVLRCPFMLKALSTLLCVC
jgi:hypothetical protein